MTPLCHVTSPELKGGGSPQNGEKWSALNSQQCTSKLSCHLFKWPRGSNGRRRPKRTHFITRAQFSPEGSTSYFACTKCCCGLLRTLIFNPPVVPPHLHLDGSLYCSQPHCNVSLCTDGQNCLFPCPTLHTAPTPPPRTLALIAPDHQYVSAADVSLLNLRREHNQPHLLQFFLSTIAPLPTKKITSALP